MHVDHLAIWCREIENLRRFYEHYFGATSGIRYHNKTKDFQSYFLTFQSGCRLELMQMPGVHDNLNDAGAQYIGIIHFAISVGSKEVVDRLTAQLRTDGFAIVGEPRTTGDGYYESIVLDPEGNRIEITA